MGVAGVALGGGRTRSDDVVDPAVGFVFERNVGDAVKAGEVIARVHASRDDKAREAVERLTAAVTLGAAKPDEVPLLLERVGG
ncbi:MAG: hypothetical protein R3A52_16245 [Polyangiales bacterium]